MHCSFAPSHTSLVVQQFLAEKIILVITQPPYSPDLAPSDFWLLYTLKMGLRGRVSQPWKTSNATTELRKIPKETFRRCFQQWQDRWSKCVCAQVSYFEGDQVSVVICPTITVLHHIFGNFLTAPRIFRIYEHIYNFKRMKYHITHFINICTVHNFNIIILQCLGLLTPQVFGPEFCIRMQTYKIQFEIEVLTASFLKN